MREVKIPQNWTYILKCSSQSGAPENIYFNYTRVTPDHEEDPSKYLTHVPIVAPENTRNMIKILQPVQQVKKILVSKRVSIYEVIEYTVYKGFRKTSKSPNVFCSTVI